MTDGLTAVLAGVSMCTALGMQLLDAWFTTKGMRVGDIEVGIVNKFFLKTKADISKIPTIAFVEFAISLVLFGAAFMYVGPLGGLMFGSTLTIAEGVNNVRSYLLLKKQKAI